MLKRIVLGSFAANCYIYYDLETKEAMVIDPGDEGKRIKHFLKELELDLIAVLLTHGHIDHIGALEYLYIQYPSMRVYIHEEDAVFLKDSRLNLSLSFKNSAFTYLHPIHLLKDQESFKLIGQNITCLHFPGHTPGSCMYALEPEHLLFSGDVLFAGSIGRYDLPLGSHGDTLQSLKNIKNLDVDYLLYPGHGERSTIGKELTDNPYLR